MKKLLHKIFKKKASDAGNNLAQIDDLQLAVGALLVEAARVDQDYTVLESSLIEASLKSMFDLSIDDAGRLLESAEAAQADAVDLYRFTKIAKTLSLGEKRRLLESLWRIILSDNERDPHENALVRRLCGLLYIPDIESNSARQRVAAET